MSSNDAPAGEGVPRARRRPSRAWLTFFVALAVGLLAALGGFIVIAAQSAKYESVATIAIDQPRALAISGDAGAVSKLAALRLKYIGIATTDQFAGPVAATLGKPTDAVRRSLFAQAPGAGLLFVIGARTGSASTSHGLAAAAADAMVSYASREQSDAGIPLGQRFTLTVVTPASPGQKIAPTRKREVGAAGLAGLVAFAAVLAVVATRARD